MHYPSLYAIYLYALHPPTTLFTPMHFIPILCYPSLYDLYASPAICTILLCNPLLCIFTSVIIQIIVHLSYICSIPVLLEQFSPIKQNVDVAEISMYFLQREHGVTVIRLIVYGISQLQHPLNYYGQHNTIYHQFAAYTLTWQERAWIYSNLFQ